jgi:hypothetical protein
MKQQSNSYMRPDEKSYTFAVSDYFTRDIREKNAATIAMALSQLDQDDIFQFTQRVIMEAQKYDDEQVILLNEELAELYYGKTNGKLPDATTGIIPLFFLRADALDDKGRVRIKGIKSNGEVLEFLPWSYWQSLKLQSSRPILEIAAKLIKAIDKLNNISGDIKSQLEEIKLKSDNLRKLFNVEIKDLIFFQYDDNTEKRNFSRERDNFITFQKESADPESRKFKIYSRDYFYNLQILISQAFNSINFSETMFHLSRVAIFISNKMYTKSKDNMFLIGPKDPSNFEKFVDLVHDAAYLSNLAANHQYFTSDERLLVYYCEQSVRSTLVQIGTKIMSLVNYILTIIPYEKRSGFGRADF